MPQIPLSLANSVAATADAARQYFGEDARTVTPRRLVTTMGVMNLAAALVAGLPLCHGSGGLTAHYRLGARTAGAPIMLGVVFVAMGLLGGTTLIPVLRLIPHGALGVLLAYVGIQHVFLARDVRGARAWAIVSIVALVAAVTQNLAFGFAAGFVAQSADTVITRVRGRGRRRNRQVTRVPR